MKSVTSSPVIDRKAKLYRRKELALGADRGAVGGFRAPAQHALARRPAMSPRGGARAQLRDLTERALLKQDHVGALVNERGDIQYLHGRSGQYLEPAPGEAAMNILKMAREGLRRELTTALHAAVANKTVVRRASLRVKTNGDFSTVSLTIRPVEAAPGLRDRARPLRRDPGRRAGVGTCPGSRRSRPSRSPRPRPPRRPTRTSPR